jgi:DNA-binding IscR family transcriptional regulator
LGRPGNRITVERILRTVRTTEDAHEISLAQSQLLSKVVVPALGKIEDAFSTVLGRITVADLTRSAERVMAPVAPRGVKRSRLGARKS